MVLLSWLLLRNGYKRYCLLVQPIFTEPTNESTSTASSMPSSSTLPLIRPMPFDDILSLLPKNQGSPDGHIGRPRNAFMIFRQAYHFFVVRPYAARQKSKIPSQEVSRVAGKLWKEMNAKERKPWEDLCVVDKSDHQRNHPDYKYVAKVKARKHSSPSESSSSRELGHGMEVDERHTANVHSGGHSAHYDYESSSNNHDMHFRESAETLQAFRESSKLRQIAYHDTPTQIPQHHFTEQPAPPPISYWYENGPVYVPGDAGGDSRYTQEDSMFALGESWGGRR